MKDLLFVYGTLMNNIQSTIASFLHHNSDFIGEGTFPGTLYDLGNYPGAVYDAQADAQVYGHIFRLHDAPNMLKRLDFYEGISPIQTEKSEYRRKMVPVDSAERKLNCWTYLYNFSTEHLQEIKEGNYLNYLKTNEAHQAFIKNH